MSELVAFTPAELATSQKSLLGHFATEFSRWDAEAADLAKSVAAALNAGLKVDRLKRALGIARKQAIYFSKLAQALERGYYVLPSFAIDVFAIRVGNNSPRGTVSTNRWTQFRQKAAALPAGEGEYVSDRPVVYQNQETHKKPDGSTELRTLYWPEQWNAVELPGVAKSSAVVKATTAAMQAKVFDDIGLLPADRGRRGGDPLLIGRIRKGSGRPWVDADHICFLIAWFIDPARDF